MCMGGCGGGTAKKGNSYSPKMMKNWGGMKSGSSSGNRRVSSSSRGGRSGGYGSPSVKMSFGKKS